MPRRHAASITFAFWIAFFTVWNATKVIYLFIYLFIPSIDFISILFFHIRFYREFIAAQSLRMFIVIITLFIIRLSHSLGQDYAHIQKQAFMLTAGRAFNKANRGTCGGES